MAILTLKNTITKIKNAIEGFKSNQARLKSELGNWEINQEKNMQNKTWKDKTLENTKASRGDGDSVRRVNICVLGIPKWRKEKLEIKL